MDSSWHYVQMPVEFAFRVAKIDSILLQAVAIFCSFHLSYLSAITFSMVPIPLVFRFCICVLDLHGPSQLQSMFCFSPEYKKFLFGIFTLVCIQEWNLPYCFLQWKKNLLD